MARAHNIEESNINWIVNQYKIGKRGSINSIQLKLVFWMTKTIKKSLARLKADGGYGEKVCTHTHTHTRSEKESLITQTRDINK